MQPIEERISAYVDGELDDAQAATLEADLRADPAARAMLARHREMAALLRAAFGESGFAAGGAALAARLPAAATGSRGTPASGRAMPRRSAVGWAMAACVLLGAAGYMTGARWPALLVSQRDLRLSDIAEYHEVFSRETTHLVEIPASDVAQLRDWFGTRLGRELVIPDLTAAGLRFAGGRMLVVDGAPVAELMYTHADGPPLAFCILSRDDSGDALRVDRRGGLSLASWADARSSYVIVGETAPQTIRALALRVRAQL